MGTAWRVAKLASCTRRAVKKGSGPSKSASGRSFSMIMATTVIYAFAVAFLNFIVDILYAYIDPRIRYS